MSDLEKRIDRLTENLHQLDSAITEDSLVARLDDLSTDQIAAITSQQAADYLRDVDETKVSVAYQILSSKIGCDLLKSLCLEFLRRPEERVRRVGAFGLGSCLRGTGDKEASHSLASVVCDPAEKTETRIGAYLSLVVINKDFWIAHSGSELRRGGLNFELRNVDWDFVGCF